MARGVRLTAPASADGTRGWLALTVLLAVGAAAVTLALDRHAIDATLLDWQPQRALSNPWRAMTAAWVHYSGLHLGANLAGAAVVGALGAVARVPSSAAWAWLLAWPLTQLGLLLRPDLVHYGGLSGVLHAGAAIVAVHLLLAARGARRAIGVAIAAGLLAKVVLEAPWGAAVRHPAGWDIAVAPFAHASGLVAGVACALAARAAARARGPATRANATPP